MDFINLISMRQVTSEKVKPNWTSQQQQKHVSRRQLSCLGCPFWATGPLPSPNLQILVVRPRLPAGCAPTNTLVGGCDEKVSEEVT